MTEATGFIVSIFNNMVTIDKVTNIIIYIEPTFAGVYKIGYCKELLLTP